METVSEVSISRKRRLRWSHVATFGGIIELKRHFGGILGGIFGGILLGGAECALYYSGMTPSTRKDACAGVMLRHLESFLEL